VGDAQPRGPDAAALAYYVSADGAALAPRDWTCDSGWGSNATFLSVAPKCEVGKQECASVNVWHFFGGTFGRFDVAQIAARVFPSAKAFVDGVINEKLPGSADIHYGAYPADKLTRLGSNVVEFETPAGKIGLGSEDGKHAWPVIGVAILLPKPDMDIVQLDVYLPPNQRGQAQIIRKAFEQAVASGEFPTPP